MIISILMELMLIIIVITSASYFMFILFRKCIVISNSEKCMVVFLQI